jgi:DNA-directed RNA polymerase specialized sigma24 family protein
MDRQTEVKNWLSRAMYADNKINALNLLIQQAKQRAEGLSGHSGYEDTAKKSSRENSTENALIKLADMELKFENQKNELLTVADEIAEAISQLHDDDLETVLIHRYLLFHSTEQTAELMNYSCATVKRKTNKAIEKMSLFELV